MERNRKAGQNPPRVVAPTEEEEEDISRTTAGCIQHAVSVHQCTKKPVESAAVSVTYAVHEVAYHIVLNGYNICNICKESFSLSNLQTAVLEHQKVALEKQDTEVK